MDAFFGELGKTVFARWKAKNFSLPAFSVIAREALEERPPVGKVDLNALVRNFLRDDDQPFQTASGFGQPEIIVFDHPRFYIQLLFWLDGTTQIHQHEFSGAFHVLEGSSLHSEFVFEDPRAISAHFRLGNLRLKRTELLPAGRTVPIVSGGGCIHSLFHLDTPSVTVVVRTHADPGTGPQFTYLPPHVAVDPFFTDSLTSRRVQLLDVLERTGDPEYGSLAREMVGDLDFERGFFVLQNGFAHLHATGEWEETWKAFRRRHGRLADPVASTLAEIVWRDTLVGFRGAVTDPEHRFFLALLLNVPTRSALLGFVRKRFAGDPRKRVRRWAEELFESSDEEAWLLDAKFPAEDVLDVLDALEDLLKGGSSAAARALRDVFAESSLRALTR